MASSQKGTKLLSVGDFKVRDLGNSVGFSLDKNALENLDVVDEDGNLKGEFYCRQVIHDDGRVEATINLEQ